MRFHHRTKWLSSMAAVALALMPLGGYALTLCICPDGAVSIDTVCEPVSCCEAENMPEARVTLSESTRPELPCASLTLLWESEVTALAVVPPTTRCDGGAVPSAAEPPVQTLAMSVLPLSVGADFDLRRLPEPNPASLGDVLRV